MWTVRVTMQVLGIWLVVAPVVWAASANGSHICDEARSSPCTTTATIDANYTLGSRTEQIIYAAGVDEGDTSRYQTTHTHTLKFQEVGGAGFVNVAAGSGAVRLVAVTGLTHNSTVTSAERRANTTCGASFLAAGKEAETANGLTFGAEVRNGDCTEAQWGLDFSNAPTTQTTYEFQVVWEGKDATDTFTYPAQVTVPAAAVAARRIIIIN